MMEELYYSDIEWTIENFSCWNHRIHTNKLSLLRKELTILAANRERFLELYPRGVSSQEEHLVLRFCNEWFSGDFEISFIGSDGSVIKTESKIIRESEFYKGPIFKTCVASIRAEEPFHKDSLTLRFRKKCSFFAKRHLRLVIGVVNASIKIDSKIFKECGFRKYDWNYMFKIGYPLEDGVITEYLDVFAFKIDSGARTNVKFKLVPVYARSARTLAKISTFHQSGTGAIVKFQDVEHMITAEGLEEVLLKSLPIKEDCELNFYIILRLKLIRANPYKSHDCLSYRRCEIKMDSTNSSKILSTAASLHPDASFEVLRKDLTRLYEDRDFCDFQLHCGQIPFHVHKGVLGARSPVFKGMFSSNMREVLSGSVDIKDLDPHTLNSFLAFLYSGKVDELQFESALKLYYAADKYQVDTLKRECVTVLCNEISVSNVCEVLLLADKHQDPKLTSVADDFLEKNYDRIRTTKEWMDLIALYPSFFIRAAELLSKKKMTLFPRFPCLETKALETKANPQESG